MRPERQRGCCRYSCECCGIERPPLAAANTPSDPPVPLRRLARKPGEGPLDFKALARLDSRLCCKGFEMARLIEMPSRMSRSRLHGCQSGQRVAIAWLCGGTWTGG